MPTPKPGQSVSFAPFTNESLLDELMSPNAPKQGNSKDRLFLKGLFEVLLYSKRTFGINDLYDLRQHLTHDFIKAQWPSLVKEAIQANRLKKIPCCYVGQELYQSECL